MSSVLCAVCLCGGAFSGETRPEVSWEQVEAWALGDALTIQVGPQKPESKPEKVDSKPETKVMAEPVKAPEPAKPPEPPAPAETRINIPPPKSLSRKADPREYAELRAKFLSRAMPRLQRLEADRSWDQAFDVSYKMENYGHAVELIGRILQDKRYTSRDTEVWAAGKMWEIGLLSNQMNNQTLEFHFKTWKERATKAIEEGKFQRGDIPHEMPQLQLRESFFKAWMQGFNDDLKRMEVAGEENPKFLWDLCIRYFDDGRPFCPMHYMLTLLKLREWHSDYEQCKSGEVQTRLVRLLWEAFNMPKEAADEAEKAIDKFPKHPGVASGDMAWIAGEANKQLGYEQKTNREALEFFKEAKQWFEAYQKKWPNAQYNHRNGDDPKPEVQKRIEEVNKNIETRQVRNK